MKKFIISIFMMLALGVNNSSTYAQSVKRVGNTFVVNKPAKSKSKPTQTKYIWEDAKGNKYPIFIGATGSCYIVKVSKKTGKEYKQYLGEEVSKQICKEMNVEYKPKN